MKKLTFQLMATLCSIIMIASVISSCQKSNIEAPQSPGLQQAALTTVSNSPTPANPNFNLEVILRGEGQSFGLVKFRQDNDIDKIIVLGTWIRGMESNHEYILQRAVDTNLDGNCTGTAWLTLGKGLVPQSIYTDENGTGREELWRSVAMLASGATFDIHFRVIDAVTSAVVLTSDCYQYTVR